MVEIKTAIPEDIAVLLANLREADRLELEASHGVYADHLSILQKGLIRSGDHAWSMFVDGDLAGVGGVVPAGSLLGGEEGIPWILGTDLLGKHPGALTRAAKDYFDRVKDVYPVMANYVDARNTKAIRWLKRLGFVVSDKATSYGPYGMPFYRFWNK